MFDFAWSEIVLTGLVAVLVLGPKELPQAMRSVGRFTRQARKLAGEFQGHVNDLVREAELEEIRTSVKKVTQTNVGTEINKFLDPGGDFASELARTEEEMKVALAGTTTATSTTASAMIETAASTTPAVTEATAVAEAALPSASDAPATAALPHHPSGEGTS